MSNHKYLTAAPVHDDEAGYTIEDGVVVDATERPTRRKVYDEWTRYWSPSREDRLAEEAAWAARSGPVIIKRKAGTAA